MAKRLLLVVSVIVLYLTYTHLMAEELPAIVATRNSSDESIARAREEVGRMDERQLRSLLGYLSECRDRSGAAAALQACAAARSRYQIEFGDSGSAVDSAIDSAEYFLMISRAISCCRTPPITNTIDVALTDAVRAALKRFRASP